MRRGEIWTVAAGAGYAGKPRPVVIEQDDAFDATESVTVRAFTTDPTDAPLFRLAVEPSDTNGLRAPCRLMVDELATVHRSKMGRQIGRLSVEDIRQAESSGPRFSWACDASAGRSLLDETVVHNGIALDQNSSCP